LNSNGLSDELLSTKTIKTEVNLRVNNPTKTMEQATHIPVQVAAILDYLISLLPPKYIAGTNKIKAGDRSFAKYQLDFYCKHFPPGHMCFVVPSSDITEAPDLNYSVIEGRSFYIIRWELNVPGIVIKCPEWLVPSQTEFFDRVDRGAHVTRVTMPTARYFATRKILKNY
jgi:hypothetical protein